MKYDVIRGNVLKSILTSAGIGFFLSGLLQLATIPYYWWTGCALGIGAGMVLLSFTLPGPRWSKLVPRVDERVPLPARLKHERWCCDSMGVCHDVRCYSDTPHACHEGRH